MKLRLLAVILLSTFAAAQASLPDAPSAWHEIEDSKPLPHRYCDGPRFFQFRKGPEDNPATNRQVMHSKAFWLQAAFMVGAEEMARTRTHSESEPWAAGAVMGFSYLGYRFFSPSFTLGMTGSGASWLKEWAQSKR